MIYISLKGVDVYLASEIEKVFLPKLASLFECQAEEILFAAHESFLYHHGVEQTTYHLVVKVEADVAYRAIEKQVATYILQQSKQYTVHCHVYFTYFETSSDYHRLDEKYPLYLTEDNMATDEEDEDQQEIFDGNAFEDYEECLDGHCCCHHKEDGDEENEGCGCGGDCECGDDCDCDEDEHCCCGDCHPHETKH